MSTEQLLPVESNEHPPISSPTPLKKKRRWGRLFFFIILLLLVASGGVIYQLWLYLQNLEQQINQQNALVQDVKQLQQHVVQAKQQQGQREQVSQSQLTTKFSELEKNLENINAQQAVFTEQLLQVQQQTTTVEKSPDVFLTEIRYLLQSAQQRFFLTHDIHSSLQILALADKRLQHNNNPLYLPLRKQLLKDIAHIEQQNHVDVTKLALQLGNMLDSANTLPLLQGQRSFKKAIETKKEEAPPPETWQDISLSIWQDMQQLVVIRRNETAHKGVLLAEQRHIVRQILSLQLTSARLSALQRDTGNFQQTLTAIETWLTQYYDQTAPQIKQMQESLNTMKKIESLAATPPNISATLTYLAQLTQQL